MRQLRLMMVALGLGALLAAFGGGAASAHQGGGPGMTALYGDGRLVVLGDDFGPDESLAVALETVDGRWRRLTARADGQGHVHLATDLSVEPGDGVRIETRGEQSGQRVAVAWVARPMPWDGVDLQWLIAAALGLATGLLGLVVLWSRRSARPLPTAG